MATTRKILSKGIINKTGVFIASERTSLPKKENEKPEHEIETKPSEAGEGDERSSVVRTKKLCQFCSNKTEPHYFDMVALRRFINDRGRIVARTRSGSCAKHQRRITKEIKRARHLALLPFTIRV